MAVDQGGDTDSEDPQSWNKYAYAQNNPIKYLDPDGKSIAEAMVYLKNQPKSQTTMTVMVGGKVHAGTGAAIYGGITADYKGNVALIGKASFTVGPGVLIQGGIEGSSRPGTVYDYSPQSQQISLDVNDGPGFGASFDDSGTPSGGIGPAEVGGDGQVTGRLSAGVGAALTQDFTRTGTVSLLGGAPPAPQAAPRSGGPVMNRAPGAAPGGVRAAGPTAVDRKIAAYKARAAQGPVKKDKK